VALRRRCPRHPPCPLSGLTLIAGQGDEGLAQLAHTAMPRSDRQPGLQFILVRLSSFQYSPMVQPAARTPTNPGELAALDLLIRGFRPRHMTGQRRVSYSTQQQQRSQPGTPPTSCRRTSDLPTTNNLVTRSSHREGYRSTTGPELTTKADHNNMRQEAVWPYTLINRFPGQRRYRTNRSYLTSEGSNGAASAATGQSWSVSGRTSG
jgi:hypothetical protein